MLSELTQETGLELRAWVPFADADSKNLDGATAILRHLGLHLHDSPERWAALLGLSASPTQRATIQRIPPRPASQHDALQPSQTFPNTGEQAFVYPVYFGTNRSYTKSADGTLQFSNERSGSLTHGACDVVIPRTHEFGSLGSPFWKRLLRLTDDRLKLKQIDVLDEEQFWQRINQQCAELTSDDRVALVYIHGYNVSFEGAALRAAQLVVDQT